MSSSYIPAALRRKVLQRAESRCEYCLLAADDSFFKHEPDHIIAEKHGGETTSDNLATACFDCNRFKGSDIASLDPLTCKLVPLFNPRTDSWQVHFAVEGGVVRPRTPTGRATARLLKLNLSERVEIRETLTKTGRYPG